MKTDCFRIAGPGYTGSMSAHNCASYYRRLPAPLLGRGGLPGWEVAVIEF
jgi:hypothetical protein